MWHEKDAETGLDRGFDQDRSKRKHPSHHDAPWQGAVRDVGHEPAPRVLLGPPSDLFNRLPIPCPALPRAWADAGCGWIWFGGRWEPSHGLGHGGRGKVSPGEEKHGRALPATIAQIYNHHTFFE